MSSVNCPHYRLVAVAFLLPMLKFVFALLIASSVLHKWEPNTPLCWSTAESAWSSFYCLVTTPIYGYLILFIFQSLTYTIVALPNMSSTVLLLKTESIVWTPYMMYCLNMLTVFSCSSFVALAFPYYPNADNTCLVGILSYPPDNTSLFMLSWGTLLSVVVEMTAFVIINHLLFCAKITKSCAFCVGPYLLFHPNQDYSVQLDDRSVSISIIPSSSSLFPTTSATRQFPSDNRDKLTVGE